MRPFARPMRKPKLTLALRGHLAMLLFSALVAGSFSLGAMSANALPPAALNAVRFLIAAVVIGVVALATKGLPSSAWRAPWRYLILGGLFAGYFVLMFEGLKTAHPVSTAAVFTLTPIMSAMFGWGLLGQITTRRMVIALTIGALGALWVIFRADWQAFRRFEVGQGELYYFWGCVLHALYTPMVRRLNRGEAPVVFTFGTLLAGLLVLLLYGAHDILQTDWAMVSAQVWLIILYLAVFASAASFVLVQFAALHLPSAKVMAYTYLVPSWVICWEIVLGNGAPSPLVLVGIALTCVALYLLLEKDF
ncbi:DMT family transporter [Shimia marina]|uniref:Carboxylate/amino acid/amine transporter n=1 Tax=Shimia marina TaxID=321267 RepID=A0A0P1FD44_9RHOB|nr:carboxylate/amino acid/amine transporter [Shimia marina]SFE11313.1 EamA-like transporter family protein [Shimia marina]